MRTRGDRRRRAPRGHQVARAASAGLLPSLRGAGSSPWPRARREDAHARASHGRGPGLVLVAERPAGPAATLADEEDAVASRARAEGRGRLGGRRDDGRDRSRERELVPVARVVPRVLEPPRAAQLRRDGVRRVPEQERPVDVLDEGRRRSLVASDLRRERARVRRFSSRGHEPRLGLPPELVAVAILARAHGPPRVARRARMAKRREAEAAAAPQRPRRQLPGMLPEREPGGEKGDVFSPFSRAS